MTAPFLMQIEQLQRKPLSICGAEKSNEIEPQWQLPLYRFIAILFSKSVPLELAQHKHLLPQLLQPRTPADVGQVDDKTALDNVAAHLFDEDAGSLNRLGNAPNDSSQLLNQFRVLIQYLEQINDGTHWHCFATFVAAECVVPAAGQFCRLLLGQFQAFSGMGE